MTGVQTCALPIYKALDMLKDELYSNNTDELVKKYPITFNEDAIKQIP